MKITVLCGGITPERDVSLRSGAMIANALISRGHMTALVDSFVGVGNADPDTLFSLNPYPVPAIAKTEPDIDKVWAEYRKPGDRAEVGQGVIEACKAADVTYIALHGGGGEGGRIQAALECFGIKYTGSGCVASAIAIDKDLTKRVIRAVGICTADWKRYEDVTDAAAAAEDIETVIGVPCVIKPLDTGSTCGLTIVREKEELVPAIALAVKYGTAFLAEKMITGRELTVPVLEDPETGKGHALPAIEILPKSGEYDYVNKYQAGFTTEICPAPIPDDIAARAAAEAEAVHREIGLRGLSRTDIIWDTASGELVVLEVNTAPGMTDTSLFPQSAAAVGISYPELCERIALMGMNK